MSNSSRPRNVSSFIAQLRDATLREMDKDQTARPAKDVSFDLNHPTKVEPEFDQDKNLVSSFNTIQSPDVAIGRVEL